MKIVFMGTPDIAAASLSELLQNQHEIAAVFTREDKPVGRKQVIVPPPVKVLAQNNGIPVYQPKNLRQEGGLETLQGLAADIIVVVAYGRILPPEILALPRYGCINLHVSLLPKYRGAAPVQWAVINGEKETGVSIMQLDEGLDTGPVFATRKVAIGPEQTTGEVFEMVTQIGSRLLCETLEDIEGGRAKAVPQQGEGSSAPALTKQDGEMDFCLPALQLHNLVRGCNPWPLAWFSFEGLRVKVQRARFTQENGASREILHTNPLTIACGEGALVLEHVTPQGSRAMTGAEWAVGRRFKAGDSLPKEIT